MKLEDRFVGETSVLEFDLETVLEREYRILTKDETVDPRDFSYHESILRPRHIIELDRLFREVNPDKLFIADAPVGLLDGESFAIKSRRADKFEDVIKGLKDEIINNKYLIMYAISRVCAVDPTTFTRTSSFKIRYAVVA